jgi:hypothetical protein
MSARLLGWVTLVVLAAVGVGWLWGASGRSAIDQARRALEERANLSDARALVIDGRLSVSLRNFGDAGQRFDRAIAMLEGQERRWRETGQPERAGQVEIVLAHLRDAARLSAALNPDAQEAAGQAADALLAISRPAAAAGR